MWDIHELARANYANHLAALDYRNSVYLAAGGQGVFMTVMQGGRRVRWCRLGGGVFDTVYGAQFENHPAGAARREVAETTRRTAKEWSEPVRWFVSALDRPADLGDLLLEHGWSPAYEWAEMGFVFDEDHSLPRRDRRFAVVPVGSPAMLRAWSEIQIAGYDLRGDAATFMKRLCASFAKTSRTRFHLFLTYDARDGSQPVGAGSLFVHRAAGGIYMVATHPDHRRRGVGRETVLHILREARRRRCWCAVLQSSEQAETLYSHIGFVKTGALEIYRSDG